jgi:hypothetical protein
MCRQKTWLSVLNAAKLTRVPTSKYLFGVNRTDQMLLVHSDGVRLEYFIRFLHLISYLSLCFRVLHHESNKF